MTRKKITRHQMRLYEFKSDGRNIANIEPSGDPLQRRKTSDKYIRLAYQNIRGVSRTGHVNTEIEAIQDLGLDIMGMSETNCPWTIQSKAEYDLMMREMFQQSRTLYSSAPSLTTGSYQPGGTLLTVNGRTTGRISLSGTDPWGRFCWCRLRGWRDEGILLISAYRVCHMQSHNPGPLTVYQQQYTLMRQAGISKPNPRKQLLLDLQQLIYTHRLEGYYPILMIDANGDYRDTTRPDKELSNFLESTNLVDPFADKFDLHPRTNIHGTKRIDYIFTDSRCTSAIMCVGYLGTHEGAYSDHCLAYMDVDEEKIFHGVLNRPVAHHSREILLAQDDKILAFVTELEARYEEHKIQDKVFHLADAFIQTGVSDDNISKYHVLYKDFLDIARGVAKQVGRKKYGYARSSKLTINGRILLVVKQMLDCKSRNAPFTPSILKRCGDLDLDAREYESYTLQQLRGEVRTRRRALWECQKRCEDERKEWLISLAKDRARAADIPDWTKKLKHMIRTTKDNAVNRKLRLVTKGAQGILDRIQIPAHDWFYSPKYDKLYHYDEGVFEAYPSAGDSSFFTHHTLKVLAPDAVLVRVGRTQAPPRWKVITTLPRPENLWIDITAQEEIEDHLIRWNKRHLEQTSREQGISTTPLLADIRAMNGINPLTSDILDGSFDTTYELTPELSEFFAALRQTEHERSLRPILGTITSEQFQTMFRMAKEKTSSDSRTLNYTLWKCMARSDTISGFAAVLLSLPFVYGFPNLHWTHMSDFMLEKKPGVRQIHTLRIIGKVAAEFNTCLKFFIGHQTMHNFEASDPHDSQYGFRPNRSSVDAAMLKLLTFETSRMQRSTVGMIQHDMASHFDRMYPAMSSIYAQKYNVDHNIMNSIALTISNLQRNVETSLGLSNSTYGQEEDAPHIGGMVQGKADVPQWSTQQSDILLRAHDRLTDGFSLPNPNGSRTIRHHSISFADDTDQHANTSSALQDAVARTVRKLEHSAQTWNNLINIPGGLLAYHKCNWQMIAWDSTSGYMDLIYNTTEELRIRDGKGAVAVIDFVPPNQPNVGLGYSICPDGNQTPQFESIYSAVQDICAGVSRAHLTESEVWQLLRTRLVPKLSYVLHLTSFTCKQCSKIDSLIRSTILPRLRFNRHFPSAVLYGPTQYGGMEFPHVYMMQTLVQLQYIIKQLRWNKGVGNDILVTVDSIQLYTGFEKPILEMVDPPITYVENSFFLSLRTRLAELDASLWIEEVWRPHLQREGDAFLMDAFVRIPGITPSELKKANAVRLYMRILTIADMADPSGKFIPDDMLTGEWQAGSDLFWPHQDNPPQSFWAVFRKCLRKTFCKRTSPHQQVSAGMDLDLPLGLWLPVPRHVWFDVYITQEYLYQRINSEIWRMRPTNHRGFYQKDRRVEIIPLDAHPIRWTQVDDQIWTHRRHHLSAIQDSPTPPPGLTVSDSISTPPEQLVIGSDASTHLSAGISTCAYIIKAGLQYIRACCNLTNISSITSYRGELEGIYRALVHSKMRQLWPRRIKLWCDNKAAIDKSATPLHTPGEMVQPEADVLLAIQALQRDSPATTCSFHHVYGHQDTRHLAVKSDHLDSPSSNSEASLDFHTPFEEEGDVRRTVTSTPRRLSQAARMNIACDQLANDTARHVVEATHRLPLTLTPPYAGTRAMLRIGETWITSKLDSHIRRAAHEHNIREYCAGKYNWSPQLLDRIAWDIIGQARKGPTPTQNMQVSKLMHGWLPVMHREGRISGIRQCPGCDNDDETLEHFFRCTHASYLEARSRTLQRMVQNGIDKGIPPLFMRQFVGYLSHTLGHNGPLRDSRFEVACQDQDDIGEGMLGRGFISVEWTRILTDMGTHHPQRKMVFLLRNIWDELFGVLWKTRNTLLHNNPNFTTELTHTQLGDRLQWYLEHRDHLARQDQFLARYSASSIDNMSTEVRRAWIQHLDAARDAWAKEQHILESGQTLITQFFSQLDVRSDPA